MLHTFVGTALGETTMRVLVLHSDVTANAPPEELDTLATAQAVGEALRAMGHIVHTVPFAMSPESILSAVHEARADIVFNLVESVLGQGSLAAAAPAMLDALGIAYTGSGAAALSLAGDKPLAKNILRSSGLPTPDWSEPPYWNGLVNGLKYIVKSAAEDASLGLDDGAIVCGQDAVVHRARLCAERHRGRWFAEVFVEGREFNVAVLEEEGRFEVLPIPEMRFEEWPDRKPRIVGYRAKWDANSEECAKTVRAFGLERQSPFLARIFADLALKACRLFGVTGYARVDFRTDVAGQPTILEVNPNPCLHPNAGFTAAAAEAGLSYNRLILRILDAANPN